MEALLTQIQTNANTKKIVSKAVLKALQEANVLDEDGYSVASLEEGLADERAGRLRSFESWDDMIKTLQQEIDDGI